MTRKLSGRAMPSPRCPSVLTWSMIRSTSAAQAATLVAAGAGLPGQPVEDRVDLRGGGILLLAGDVGLEGHDRREPAGCRVAVPDEAQGLGARRALRHDEGVDGRLDVLDGGELAHRRRARRRDGRVADVDPGQRLGVGAEAAAAPVGEQVAPCWFSPSTTISPLSSRSNRLGVPTAPRATREAGDDEETQTTTTARARAGDHGSPAPQERTVARVVRGHGHSVPRGPDAVADGPSACHGGVMAGHEEPT